MRAKDKCPSCFQPVAPTDFLCANCELILDPSQAPEGPVGDVSVVRRMLEAPQRGLPSGQPNPRPPRSSPSEGLEGPTRKLDLGPELSGVPVVVATLARKSGHLSEFEAWVVSLVDGLSDSVALAKKAGVRELELRVVLRTLQEKQIIDFADEPLSDADLEMPSVIGTLDEEDEFITAPGVPDAAPDYGANTGRRDGRFAAPPSRGGPELTPALTALPDPPVPAPVRVPAPPFPGSLPGAAGRVEAPPLPDPLPAAPLRIPAPPLPGSLPFAPARVASIAPGPEVVTGRRGPIIRAGRAAVNVPPPPPLEALVESPIVQGRVVPSVLPPAYPGSTAEERAGLPPSRAVGSLRPPAPPLPPVERTDPRINYSGLANRRVLDALKKVKRSDAPSSSSAPKEEKEQPLADVLARDMLQVALRMEQGGRLDEAIRFLEKSISQSPDAASLYNRLGIIMMRERADYRRAESLIKMAIELAPENTVYTTNLQQVLSQAAMRSQRSR